MLSGRYGHAAVALNSGFVLLTGGQDDMFAVTASSELYDPPSGPHAGGALVLPSPAAKLGVAGQRVKAGSFWISNMSDLFETVSDATVVLSDPVVFSSVTMMSGTGRGRRSTNVDFPGASAQFIFDPPIELAPGATLELKLKARLAKHQHAQVSSQALTGLSVTNWLGAAVSSGLPANLGTVIER